MSIKENNLVGALEAYVSDENMLNVVESVYPFLSQKGKKHVKQFWRDNGGALTPQTFNQICDLVVRLTSVDVREATRRGKKNTLAHFLVCYALYFEYVACKKTTLKAICEQYLPSTQHSQIIYAAKAVENSLHLDSVRELVFQFAKDLENGGMGNLNRRLISVMAAKNNLQTIEPAPNGTND